MSKRKYSNLIATLTWDDEMVHQIYNDIRVKLWTRNRHMRAGETRRIDLTLVEDEEYMEGHEVVQETWTRNPKVWQGEYINVHLDKNGHYQVHLKNLEMGDGFNAVRIGNAITTEFKTAQKVLGLCKK
jgi:hypothetical protein